MPRIYTEIRIAHETEDQKDMFEILMDQQVIELGVSSRAEYVRLITRLDSATGIINKLKEP